MVQFTDALTGSTVHINAPHIVGVFTVHDGEHKGKTAITLINGNVVVQEDEATVVGTIKSELSNGCCK